MKYNFLLIMSMLISFGCSTNKPSENEIEIERKARELINTIDTSTLSFLKTWNYTNRMNYYDIWTKVKSEESLRYSFLYEPVGDTSFIEIYEVANFLKDYKTKFRFDTVSYSFYRLAKVDNDIVSIYPDGEISGSRNLISDPVHVDSFFVDANPFSELEQISHYKEQFNFSYCIYSPDKGNFIRFSFSNSNENILYYIPNDLVINDSNLIRWFDKFARGKRLAYNWILMEKDALE